MSHGKTGGVKFLDHNQELVAQKPLALTSLSRSTCQTPLENLASRFPDSRKVDLYPRPLRQLLHQQRSCAYNHHRRFPASHCLSRRPKELRRGLIICRPERGLSSASLLVTPFSLRITQSIITNSFENWSSAFLRET